MPLQKMTKKEMKQQSKPWISQEIINNIKERDKLQKLYITTKQESTKTEYHRKFKDLRT